MLAVETTAMTIRRHPRSPIPSADAPQVTPEPVPDELRADLLIRGIRSSVEHLTTLVSASSQMRSRRA